jgi:hypothetical protein
MIIKRGDIAKWGGRGTLGVGGPVDAAFQFSRLHRYATVRRTLVMYHLTGTLASSCAAQLDWQDGQRGKNDHLARKKVKTEPPGSGGEPDQGAQRRRHPIACPLWNNGTLP